MPRDEQNAFSNDDMALPSTTEIAESEEPAEQHHSLQFWQSLSSDDNKIAIKSRAGDNTDVQTTLMKFGMGDLQIFTGQSAEKTETLSTSDVRKAITDDIRRAVRSYSTEDLTQSEHVHDVNVRGQAVRLVGTGDPDLWVATSGDKIYLLNERHPNLDVLLKKNKDGTISTEQEPKQPLSREDQREQRTMEREMINRLWQHSLHSTTGDKQLRRDLVDTASAISQSSADRKVISQADMHDNMFSHGLQLIRLGEPERGTNMLTDAMSRSTKLFGAGDPRTMEIRSSLIGLHQNQLDDMRRPQEPPPESKAGRLYAALGARTKHLLDTQVASLEKLDQKGDVLSGQRVTARGILIDQLVTGGQRDTAKRLRESAAERLLKISDSELNASGVDRQRSMLLTHYLADGPSHKAENLLSQASKAFAQLVKDPDRFYEVRNAKTDLERWKSQMETLKLKEKSDKEQPIRLPQIDSTDKEQPVIINQKEKADKEPIKIPQIGSNEKEKPAIISQVISGGISSKTKILDSTIADIKKSKDANRRR